MVNRPKRRKSKDNPYTLIYNEIKNTYSVMFKDGENNTHLVEIKKEIFDAMDRFELDDLSEMNEYDNHIEHSEVKEITLNKRMLYKQNEIDDIIQAKFESRELKRAISCLSDVQKRRIKLYYFEDKTEQQIAEDENATQQSVHIILERALENLKKYLKIKI